MSQDRTDFGPSWFRVHGTAPVPVRRRMTAGLRHVRRDRSGPRETPWPMVSEDQNIPTRDVMCAGMYRACSTWQYEVVGHLVEAHRQGRRMGYVSGDDYRVVGARNVRRRGNGQPEDWRVLKSHEGHRSFSHALRAGRAIAVYAFRDIRDVVCSLMHKRGASYRQLLRQGMVHQILANDRYWRAQPRVLIQRYEEMVADPVTAVVQMARHLGLGVARRQAVEIAEEYSLASNLTRIEALRQQLEEAGVDLTDADNLQIYDPVTLLHWNHVRPDGSGSWQTRLSAREGATLARMCAPWLAANGYDWEAASGEEPALSLSDGMGSVRERLDRTLGRAVVLLRGAASSCPLAARLTRQLLRIAQPALRCQLAWTVSDPSSLPGCSVRSPLVGADLPLSIDDEPLSLVSCPSH